MLSHAATVCLCQPGASSQPWFHMFWHSDTVMSSITHHASDEKVTVVLGTTEPEPLSMLRTLRLKIVSLTYFGFDLDVLGDEGNVSPINLAIYSQVYHLDITAKQIH